jgi:hypothetical protein
LARILDAAVDHWATSLAARGHDLGKAVSKWLFVGQMAESTPYLVYNIVAALADAFVTFRCLIHLLFTILNRLVAFVLLGFVLFGNVIEVPIAGLGFVILVSHGRSFVSVPPDVARSPVTFGAGAGGHRMRPEVSAGAQ